MRTKLFLTACLFGVASATNARAQASDPKFEAAVDSIANQTLTTTGVPSASIAVVQHGRIVYAKAFGASKLEPRTAASTDMRYAVGSISKQFTAAAMLKLQEQGKLKL